jgi:N-acetylglucosaminyldiphosphoundecaprenol N-acetyl-beta-D-mannosaminyltransferase
MRRGSWPVVQIAGLPFAVITEQEAVQHIVQTALAGTGGWLITPNLDIVRQCVASPAVAALARQADLLVADGMPLVWASRLQGTALPGRVAGSNLVEAVSAEAAVHGLTLFMLGGDEGIADLAKQRLEARYPGLRVVGTYCPPLGFEKDLVCMQQMSALITQCAPDIVYVALGFPKQERLIQALRATAPDAWWLGIGISLSFSAGEVTRAPMWMQRCGLEWMHRMVQDPRRLVRRYLVHGLPFAVRLLWGAAWARKQHQTAK